MCLKTCPQKAVMDIKEKLIFAIGTDDKKTIKADDHVGMSKYYSMWEYSNGDMTFKGERENIKYKEDESIIHGDPEKAKKVISVLAGVDAIVGKMLGPNIVQLKVEFIPIVVREKYIKKAIKVIKENINEMIEEKNKKERTGIILK